jgi:hypothetical protein
MTTFSHPITIIGQSGDSETIEALVDVDHLFALIPYAILRRLDFWPDRSHRYRARERGLGQVQGELLGQRGSITYLVAAENESPRIGRHTLDSFVVDVDAESKTLVPKTLRMIEHAH